MDGERDIMTKISRTKINKNKYRYEKNLRYNSARHYFGKSITMLEKIRETKEHHQRLKMTNFQLHGRRFRPMKNSFSRKANDSGIIKIIQKSPIKELNG